MKPTRKRGNNPAQTEFVGIIWQSLQHPFRLHAGDVIRFNGRLCRVIRVNECAAVVIMNRPVRVFKTRFDKPVRFRPPPPIPNIVWTRSYKSQSPQVPAKVPADL